MRIVKVKQNGDAGRIVLSASTFIVRGALSDQYTVTFEAQGLDQNLDPQTFRLTLSRNELKTLNAFADLLTEG